MPRRKAADVKTEARENPFPPGTLVYRLDDGSRWVVSENQGRMSKGCRQAGFIRLERILIQTCLVAPTQIAVLNLGTES